VTGEGYDRRNARAQSDLVQENWGRKLSRRDKDIFNLKYMVCGIRRGSLLYRMGCAATMRRALERLERAGDGEAEGAKWENARGGAAIARPRKRT
jgi:hypothetical protein